VFRMLMGMGLKEMGKLISRNFVTVSNYELGKIKSIPLDEAMKMSAIIFDNLPKSTSEETLIQNLTTFRDKSRGGLLQALKRAETMQLTKQENAVRGILESQGIEFETHVTLETRIGPLNVDFLANGNTVIDCTSARSKWKAESLDFRAIKVRETHPDFKIIAIVPSNVDQGFLRRLADFDVVLKDDEIGTLTALV
jgi:hypothetical protein